MPVVKIDFKDETITDEEAGESPPTSWLWDFGDGNTSTEQNPTHEYAEEGIYTLTFTAYNVYGSNSKTEQIEVTCPPDGTPPPGYQWVFKYKAIPHVVYSGETGCSETSTNSLGYGNFPGFEYIDIIPEENKMYISADKTKKWVLVPMWEDFGSVEMLSMFRSGISGYDEDHTGELPVRNCVASWSWKHLITQEAVEHPLGAPDIIGGSTRTVKKYDENDQYYWVEYMEVANAFKYYELEPK